jgi:hypothetical protein
MVLATRVRVVLAETPHVGLSGVRVALYDRDVLSADDHLGSGVTDARGEYVFSYNSDLFTDSEDGPDWKIASLPDLYVIVYNAAGAEVFNQRAQALEDQLPKLISITIPRALALEHGLLSAAP